MFRKKDQEQDAEHWKQRYYSVLEEYEAKEKSWSGSEAVLRRTISRLTLLADGIDKKLDRDLDRLALAELLEQTRQCAVVLGRLVDDEVAAEHADGADRPAGLAPALGVDGFLDELRDLGDQRKSRIPFTTIFDISNVLVIVCGPNSAANSTFSPAATDSVAGK